MPTVGLGEGLAIASLALQLIEVARKCAELVDGFRSFGETATKLSKKARHEILKIEPLRNILIEPNKFGLGKPLFDMLQPACQHDVRNILLEIIRSLQRFRQFAEKYHLESTRMEEDSLEPLTTANIDTNNQVTDLFLVLRNERFLQTTTTWVKKARWSAVGKGSGHKLVQDLRDWLTLLQECIDGACWSPEFQIQYSQNTLSRQFEQLGSDKDLHALGLDVNMVMRKVLLQMHTVSLVYEPRAREKIDRSRVQLGLEIQNSRWMAKLDGSEALVEGRPFTESSQDAVVNGMKQLCDLLEMARDENFRLPLPSGLCEIATDDGTMVIGLIFKANSFGTQKATEIWSLARVLSPDSKAKSPSIRIPSLESRIQLSFSVVKALAKFHSVGWLHEGVQSRNVCVVASPGYEILYGKPFLLGFSKSRGMNDASFEDDDPLNNLYRHPERWVPNPKSRHTAIHDIYSLGIVLLEIGLWKLATELLVTSKTSKSFNMVDWDGPSVQRHLRKWLPNLRITMGSCYAEIVSVFLEARGTVREQNVWAASDAKERILHAIAALGGLQASMTVDIQTIQAVI